jgi:transposase InsO family protein
MAPQEGDLEFDQQKQVILGPERLQLLAIHVTPADSSILDAIRSDLVSDPVAQDILSHLASGSPGSGTSRRSDYDQFRFSDSLILRNDLVYVPPGTARLQVLQSHHDTPLAGHFGVTKTVELISRNYWWPRLRHSVEEFIRSCDTCARAKVPRHRPYGLLQPLSAPTTPWSCISMDFVTDLPVVQGFDAILVVVDRFTKMAHFLPCTKTISSEGTADLVMKDVFRLHGLPDNIVSDRGPQFIAKFWQRLLELLKIKRSLTSGYHPESDGQSERTIQTLEQYLRCFINYQQDDWLTFLPLAEFSYNNSKHASIGVSPFYALTGQHPRWDFATPGSPVNPSAEDRLDRLQSIHEELREHLLAAQEHQKKAADRYRKATPVYQVGDKVWLLRRNIRTTRPCEKFDFQRLGPFPIAAQINDVAYRLELPSSMHIHPVFHVSLLEPYQPNILPGRMPPPPAPVIVNNDLEYEVNEILDSKFLRRRLYYLVDWVGYPPSERSWEPATHLQHSPDAVHAFHRRYPDKPGPRRRGVV